MRDRRKNLPAGRQGGKWKNGKNRTRIRKAQDVNRDLPACRHVVKCCPGKTLDKREDTLHNPMIQIGGVTTMNIHNRWHSLRRRKI
jgi:hypothetical protein